MAESRGDSGYGRRKPGEKIYPPVVVGEQFGTILPEDAEGGVKCFDGSEAAGGIGLEFASPWIGAANIGGKGSSDGIAPDAGFEFWEKPPSAVEDEERVSGVGTGERGSVESEQEKPGCVE